MSYVGSPYNFVPFYDKVVKVEKESMDVRGNMSDDLLTGEITYSINAKTPIAIDDGNGSFFKNEDGKYSIPGSTMRGLIRNNCQILGLSSYDEDIDDYSLMYRNIANGAEKEHYGYVLGVAQKEVNGSKISILENVYAGYIAKKGKGYVIYKNVNDKQGSDKDKLNYYVVSAKTILKNWKNYSFFNDNPNCLPYKRGTEFERNVDKNKRIHYVPKNGKRDETDEYAPFFKEILYKVSNSRIDSIVSCDSIEDPEANGYQRGYLTGTGKMNEKKVLYVIPMIDRESSIDIPDKDIKSYNTDYNFRKNSLVSHSKNPVIKKRVSDGLKKFFKLPEREDEIRPVFYIQLNRLLYFGYTPRLRLFYENSVKKGLRQDKLKDNEYDYACSMFGMSTKRNGKNVSYRSKVSFSDAVVCGDTKEPNKKEITLESPKPTSYLDYIEQESGKTVKTYNDSDFRLRGVKQYWLHNNVVDGQVAEVDKTTISPLPEGSEFKGTIRFNNLTRNELGLLLWAVKLEKDSWMNVGKAKSYGYGAISFDDIRVRLIDYKKAYSLDSLDINPFIDGDIDLLIKEYKQNISGDIGKNIEELPHIKAFFAMKDSTRIPKDNTEYMSIDGGDYKERVNNNSILPTPLQVIKGEAIQTAVRKGKAPKNVGNNRSMGNKGSSKQGYSVSYVTPSDSPQKTHEAKKLSAGEYTFECKECKGSKVKFFCNGSYPIVSWKNIDYSEEEFDKKTFSNVFAKGTKWKVEFAYDSNDNPKVIVIEKL